MKKIFTILLALLPVVAFCQEAPQNAKTVFFDVPGSKQAIIKSIERSLFDFYFTGCWYNSDSTLIISNEREFTQAGSLPAGKLTAMFRISEYEGKHTLYISGTCAIDVTKPYSAGKVVATNSTSFLAGTSSKNGWDSLMMLVESINKDKKPLFYELNVKSD